MLSEFELTILANVPTYDVSGERCYVAWNGRNGAIEMGPCRFRRTINGEIFFECSPFPGAWSMHVRMSDILRVRHLDAMN